MKEENARVIPMLVAVRPPHHPFRGSFPLEGKRAEGLRFMLVLSPLVACQPASGGMGKPVPYDKLERFVGNRLACSANSAQQEAASKEPPRKRAGGPSDLRRSSMQPQTQKTRP